MEEIPMEQRIGYIKDTLYVIGGKWKVPILAAIYQGQHRFRDIQRAVPPITTRVLSKELKDLEQNKLVVRTIYDDPPLLVKYTLSDYSQTLVPLIEGMVQWGQSHRKKVTER